MLFFGIFNVQKTERCGMLRRAMLGAVLGLKSDCALADFSFMFAHTNETCDSKWPSLDWAL